MYTALKKFMLKQFWKFYFQIIKLENSRVIWDTLYMSVIRGLPYDAFQDGAIMYGLGL